MTTINKLTAVDTVSASDQFPLYSAADGDTRRCSGTTLVGFLQDNVTLVDDKITQYSAPSATGFTATVSDVSDNIWLILTPVAGYAAGTIKLPASTTAVDRQEIMVNCTQSVTALTMNGNGATVTGAPTALSANAFFTLRFDAVTTTWYRVG
jgi:hypothetical protein